MRVLTLEQVVMVAGGDEAGTNAGAVDPCDPRFVQKRIVNGVKGEVGSKGYGFSLESREETFGNACAVDQLLANEAAAARAEADNDWERLKEWAEHQWDELVDWTNEQIEALDTSYEETAEDWGQAFLEYNWMIAQNPYVCYP